MNNISTPQEPEEEPKVTGNNGKIPMYKVPFRIKNSENLPQIEESLWVPEATLEELHKRISRKETGRDGDRPFDKE